MKIFAHRGLVFEYPENTLISFRNSLKRGFSLEIDLRVTADNHLVVIHDPCTGNLNNINLIIRNSNLKDLKKIDFGEKVLEGKFSNKGIRIPTFSEVLKVFLEESKENLEIAIQIKDYNVKNIERLFVSVLNEFDKDNPNFEIYKKVFVFDLTIELFKKLKKIQPKLKTSFSVGEGSRFPDLNHPTIYNYNSIKNIDYEIVWGDEWVGGLYSKEFIEKCHKDRRLVYAISPELHRETNPRHSLSNKGYEETWEKLILWGVDGICTDYPDKLKNLHRKIINDNTF